MAASASAAVIKAVDDEAVVITLPDAPAGTDPDHRLLLDQFGRSQAGDDRRADGQGAASTRKLHPIDDDETETVEIAGH
jgi:ribosome maturation factor RimP